MMNSKGDKINFIDGFLAFNEIDLCLFRINHLRGVVDRFVIAESSVSHSGQKKELFFQNWFKKNIDFYPDVIVLNVNLEHFSDSWSREIHTREYLESWIFETFPDSNYSLSDLDEIPSRDQVESMIGRRQYFHFRTPTYYRKLNLKLIDKHVLWSRGVMGHTSLQRLPNGGRFSDIPTLESKNHGSHFSYLVKSNQGISAKLEGFAHIELNRSLLKTDTFLKFVDDYQIDHLGRFMEPGSGLLEFVPQNEFTVMQKELFSMYPDFAAILETPRSKQARLFASFIVTVIITRPTKANIFYRIFLLRDGTFIEYIQILPFAIIYLIHFLIKKSKYFLKHALRTLRNRK
jgi:beta-1,4-mannosyl-glycoprotein beta-1,4-N-acetylglucosaminyltransferase